MGVLKIVGIGMLVGSAAWMFVVTVGGVRRWWRGDPDPPGIDDLFG